MPKGVNVSPAASHLSSKAYAGLVRQLDVNGHTYPPIIRAARCHEMLLTIHLFLYVNGRIT
ncbi:MAG: hypothetical protein HC828_05720 [Blastochloris sp.]|nr:hypothetical protein [Blastochloris sp.]